MKTTAILTLLGALIGLVIASFIVPPALAWYTSPGGLPQGAQIQAVVQIPEVIRSNCLIVLSSAGRFPAIAALFVSRLTPLAMLSGAFV